MIADRKAQINVKIEHKVKIIIIKMPLFTKIDYDEYSNINNLEIISKIVSSIGKSAQRSIKDILKYIVSNLVEKEIFNPQQPVINLRILDNGRNVDKKVKHIMITFAVLDNNNNIYNFDHYYIIILYSRFENYKFLDIATTLLQNELHELTKKELIINKIN